MPAHAESATFLVKGGQIVAQSKTHPADLAQLATARRPQ
jgi:hypothetical protein